MTILSTETFDDIRRLHDIWVARLAFEYRCERHDILAVIQPRQAESSQTAAASTSAPTRSDVKAEGDPHDPSAALSQAKASEDSGATEQDIELPADSVTGDASRESVGSGTDAPIQTTECAPDRGPEMAPKETASDEGESIDSLSARRHASPDRRDGALAADLGTTQCEDGASPALSSEPAVGDAQFRDRLDWEDEDGAQPATVIHAEEPALEAVSPGKSAEASASAALPGEEQTVKPAKLAKRINAYLVEHPNAASREIADALGVNINSISWAAKRASIFIRKLTPEEHAEASRQGGLKTAAARSAKRPVPVAAVPAPTPAVLERHPFDPIEPPPRPKVSSAGRFYVRDTKGRYLHQSLEASPTDDGPLMTSNRKWAWFDSAQRYAGACRRWPEIASMRKEAPQP